MHIHGGQLNASLSASSAQASRAALTAERRELTRKKLFEAAVQTSPDTNSAWMIEAWTDGSDPSQSSAQQNAQQKNDAMHDSTETKPTEAHGIARTPSTGPVSFWA